MNIPETLSKLVGGLTDDSVKPAGTEDAKHAPNAVDLLKTDHREVEALFEKVLDDKSTAMAQHAATIKAICDKLELHTKIEEKLLYPVVQEKSKRASKERQDVNEAVEEHAAAKDLIKKIRRTTSRDETLKAKLTVLQEMIAHHVKEEESTFFPETEKLLGKDRMHAIGLQIEKMKARAEGGSRTKRGKTTAKKPPAKKAASTATRRKKR